MAPFTREELKALGNETVLKRLPRMAAMATGIDDFRRQLTSGVNSED